MFPSSPSAMLPLLLSLLTTTSRADTLRYGTTPNGFSAPARGWTSAALQSLSADSPAKFALTQANVMEQCDAMRAALSGHGYEYCALGAGWSQPASGDEHGRIAYDRSKFDDLPALAAHLHAGGAKLGVYALPGYYAADGDKTIEGTDVPLSSIRTDEREPCRAVARCNIDYDKAGAQEYCNSNVRQFADWGVDLIKLDYVTPGSPDAGADLSGDNSGSVACYHKAIQQSGRKMRLHVGWELDRNATYYDIWRSNADALRTDRTIANANQTTLTRWSSVQRAVERYRQYILPQLDSAAELTIHPDLDALLVGNAASLTGLTDLQQRAVLTHWVGAGSPLLLGTDMTALASSSSSAGALALLTDPRAGAVAAFTAARPMVPTRGNDDAERGRRRQIWLAGPDPDTGVVVAVLANYGASNDSLFASDPDGDDADEVFRLSPKDLGLAASGYYAVEDVWANTTVDLGYNDVWTWTLDAGGDAALLRLTPSMTGDGNDTDAADAATAEAQQGKRDILERTQKPLFVQYADRDVLTSATASGQATAAAANAERTDSASDASSVVVVLGGTASWGKVLLWLSVAGLQTAVLWLL